jgi:hypothetical protein
MELVLRKDQEKKKFGGVRFNLLAKVNLNDEERELVQRFKADSETIYYNELTVPFIKKTFTFNITIKELMAGNHYTCDSIYEVLEREEGVKEACKNFYIFLEAMKSFGGEETISYPEALQE